jgi:hypothetical protein
MGTVRDSCSPPLNRTRQQQQQVLLFAVVTLGCVVLQAEGASVNVSSSSELLAALQQQQVDRIVLQNDVAIGADFDKYEQQQSPLQITRCGLSWSRSTLTILSALIIVGSLLDGQIRQSSDRSAPFM